MTPSILYNCLKSSSIEDILMRLHFFCSAVLQPTERRDDILCTGRNERMGAAAVGAGGISKETQVCFCTKFSVATGNACSPIIHEPLRAIVCTNDARLIEDLSVKPSICYNYNG